MKLSTELKELSRIYAKIGAGQGLDSGAMTPEEADCMQARVVESNFRKAEAALYAAKSPVNSLQVIRTFVSRGFFVEAKELVIHTLNNPELLTSPELRIEYWTELARVEHQLGNWEQSIIAINRVIDTESLSAIYRVNALQIRVSNWFELADWSRALRDLESIRSLQQLYPNAQTCFYSEVLRLKILARMGAPTQVRSEYRTLMSKVLNGEYILNTDSILTLLRLRIDFQRLSHEPVSNLAYACYLLADAMGDSYYSGLAMIDLAYGEARGFASQAVARLPALRTQFQKIDSICSQISLQEPTTELARNILLYEPARLEGSDRFLEDLPKYLVSIHPSFRICLSSLIVSRFEIQRRSSQILSEILGRRIARNHLFLRVWGLRYKAEVHDVVLRNATTRLRKQTGLPIEVESGSVGLASCFALDLGD